MPTETHFQIWQLYAAPPTQTLLGRESCIIGLLISVRFACEKGSAPQHDRTPLSCMRPHCFHEQLFPKRLRIQDSPSGIQAPLICITPLVQALFGLVSPSHGNPLEDWGNFHASEVCSLGAAAMNGEATKITT